MKNVNNDIVKDKWYFCMIIYNWTNWCIILQTVLINKEKNKVKNTKDQELVALFLSLLLLLLLLLSLLLLLLLL